MQSPIAVVPGALYRAAATLHDELPARPAPAPDVDGGWAATTALGLTTGAVTDRLAGLVDSGTAIAAALRAAARAYELSDAQPYDRRAAAGPWLAPGSLPGVLEPDRPPGPRAAQRSRIAGARPW
jgi:hypothetical protein